MKAIPYAAALGSMMYAQVCTRPDISFAMGLLGRYQSNPGMEHWKALKKVMRYLQGTKDFKLTYEKTDHLEVVGYTDADFAGCLDSRKSTSGYVFLLAGGAVSWKSAKQHIVATSTMEAEFIGCYEASSHALWLKKFISGLMTVDSISKPLRLHCDNSAVIFFSNYSKSTGANKHIDVKYLSVQERINNHLVSISFVSSAEMIADPMTKALTPNVFLGHVKNMGLSVWNN